MVLTTYFRGIEDVDELALAMTFFSVYAKSHSEFRQYVLGQNLISLVSHLWIPTDAYERLCYALCNISRSTWAIPALLQTDLCNAVLQALE
jgi:hypothetical protein